MDTFVQIIQALDNDNKEIYEEYSEILMNQTGIMKHKMTSCTKMTSSHKMNYAAVETMACHLSIQLQALERRGYSLLFWQLSDIVVFATDEDNKGIYVLANLAQLVRKKDEMHIVLNYPAIYPFPKDVCAPEVLTMAALPFITHKGASYYSLALLCLKALQLSLEDLHLLRGTKLYYFLERCLKDDPSERILLITF